MHCDLEIGHSLVLLSGLSLVLLSVLNRHTQLITRHYSHGFTTPEMVRTSFTLVIEATALLVSDVVYLIIRNPEDSSLRTRKDTGTCNTLSGQRG